MLQCSGNRAAHGCGAADDQRANSRGGCSRLRQSARCNVCRHKPNDLTSAIARISMQTPVVHLASEHSVGFELEAACGAAFQHEAGALCPAGEPPYKLRGDPSSGCTSYFWCSPTRGACVRACAGGACTVGKTASAQYNKSAAPTHPVAMGAAVLQC